MTAKGDDDKDTDRPPIAPGAAGFASFADDDEVESTRVADLRGLAAQAELDHVMSNELDDLDDMPEGPTRVHDLAGFVPYGPDDDDVPTTVSDAHSLRDVLPQGVDLGPRPQPMVRPPTPGLGTPVPPDIGAPPTGQVMHQKTTPSRPPVTKSFPPPRDPVGDAPPWALAPMPAPMQTPEAISLAENAPQSGGLGKWIVLALLLGMAAGGGVVAFLVLSQ